MADPTEPILVAKGERDVWLLPQMANRHGLIASVRVHGTARWQARRAAAKSAARAVGSQLGRQILRGMFGSILGGKSR